MEKGNLQFPLGLTFDDVLLLPGFADFSRSTIDITTRLTAKIQLKIPFISAPMDTVTESQLAIALAKMGGIGIIHRNLSVEDQAREVHLVKEKHLLVGAAIGASEGFKDRVTGIIAAGVDIVVVDSAHGYTTHVIETVKAIKTMYPQLQVIAGNVATGEGTEALIAAGADAIRVGMGPGAICTTRIISGMGVPQVTAIMESVKVANKKNIPIIADGGIKYSGDMVKALAAGAETIMMGSFFASAAEAPGDIVTLTKKEVPHRFQSIFSKEKDTYQFKSYRGMGSIGAMERGAAIKSEGEFHGKDYKDRVLVPEGVEGLVPIKGTVSELLDQAIGGIKSGMYYVGKKTLQSLREDARFIQITQASLTESHPHDILITNPGKNY